MREELDIITPVTTAFLSNTKLQTLIAGRGIDWNGVPIPPTFPTTTILDQNNNPVEVFSSWTLYNNGIFTLPTTSQDKKYILLSALGIDVKNFRKTDMKGVERYYLYLNPNKLKDKQGVIDTISNSELHNYLFFNLSQNELQEWRTVTLTYTEYIDNPYWFSNRWKNVPFYNPVVYKSTLSQIKSAIISNSIKSDQLKFITDEVVALNINDWFYAYADLPAGNFYDSSVSVSLISSDDTEQVYTYEIRLMFKLKVFYDTNGNVVPFPSVTSPEFIALCDSVRTNSSTSEDFDNKYVWSNAADINTPTSLTVVSNTGSLHIRVDGLRYLRTAELPTILSKIVDTGYTQKEASWWKKLIAIVLVIAAIVVSIVTAQPWIATSTTSLVTAWAAAITIATISATVVSMIAIKYFQNTGYYATSIYFSGLMKRISTLGAIASVVNVLNSAIQYAVKKAVTDITFKTVIESIKTQITSITFTSLTKTISYLNKIIEYFYKKELSDISKDIDTWKTKSEYYADKLHEIDNISPYLNDYKMQLMQKTSKQMRNSFKQIEYMCYPSSNLISYVYRSTVVPIKEAVRKYF